MRKWSHWLCWNSQPGLDMLLSPLTLGCGDGMGWMGSVLIVQCHALYTSVYMGTDSLYDSLSSLSRFSSCRAVSPINF